MSGLRVYEPAECGVDGYPIAWHEAIKDQVREEAFHRCVRCKHPYESGSGEWSPCDQFCEHQGPLRGRDLDGPGIFDLNPEADNITAGEWAELGNVEAQWRILTVHHLTGEKRDCRWWNLAALCQRCHLQVQGRVKMEQVYPHEHSDWFKPYAAGYYAATYLGEDLEREQTEDRLDELLALELAA